jgi:uncharacterized repeat protein (TIGR01451 family)
LGQNLKYHLTVTNNGTSSGPSTTSGVTVTDALPAGATLVSATTSVGRRALNAGALRWCRNREDCKACGGE